MKNIIRTGYLLSRYPLNKLIFIALLSLVSACQWVHDDYSGCATGAWLKVSYTYNILDVDAALNQVDDISILVFDSENRYITTQNVDSASFNDFEGVIRLDLTEGVYNLLVIGGLYDENYLASELEKGVTTLSQVCVKLNDDGDYQHSSQLSSLFHGLVGEIEIFDYYQQFQVSLMKNTNDFSCLLQCDSASVALNPEDFSFELVADNSIMDYQNNIVADSAFNYSPYNQKVIQVEDLSGSNGITSTLHANINTLRLMEGDNSRFIVKHTPTSKTIIDLPLTTYLILSGSYYTANGMGNQEYLDRQDAHSLIFYLQESDNSETGYVCNIIAVNSWIIRFNEVILPKD